VEAQILERRFLKARQVTGTHKLHAVIPTSVNRVVTKVYSFSSEMKEEDVMDSDIPSNEVLVDEIRRFVTCKYKKQWWLGCVLEVNNSDETVKITFLRPHAFYIIHLSIESCCSQCSCSRHMLTIVDPITVTGRTYNLTKEEADQADRMMNCQIWMRYVLHFNSFKILAGSHTSV